MSEQIDAGWTVKGSTRHIVAVTILVIGIVQALVSLFLASGHAMYAIEDSGGTSHSATTSIDGMGSLTTEVADSSGSIDVGLAQEQIVSSSRPNQPGILNSLLGVGCAVLGAGLMWWQRRNGMAIVIAVLGAVTLFEGIYMVANVPRMFNTTLLVIDYSPGIGPIVSCITGIALIALGITAFVLQRRIDGWSNYVRLFRRSRCDRKGFARAPRAAVAAAALCALTVGILPSAPTVWADADPWSELPRTMNCRIDHDPQHPYGSDSADPDFGYSPLGNNLKVGQMAVAHTTANLVVITVTFDGPLPPVPTQIFSPYAKKMIDAPGTFSYEMLVYAQDVSEALVIDSPHGGKPWLGDTSELDVPGADALKSVSVRGNSVELMVDISGESRLLQNGVFSPTIRLNWEGSGREDPDTYEQSVTQFDSQVCA